MDEKFLDVASQVEEAARQRAIDASTKATQPERHPEFDGENCVDCGDEVHPVRLMLGRIRCVPCQEIIEKGVFR